MRDLFFIGRKGSAVAYLFLAVFLAGLIVMTMMKDSDVATVNAQLREVKMKLTTDLDMIESAIHECILTHSDPVDANADGIIDADDNPHPPYPLYDDLSWGAAGENIRDIRCPGSGRKILGPETGRFFKLIGDSSRYEVTYLNTPTDGIQIIIDNSLDTNVWDEALAQLAAAAPACKMAVDSSTGTCAAGSCLTFWVKRVSCPPPTSPVL